MFNRFTLNRNKKFYISFFFFRLKKKQKKIFKVEIKKDKLLYFVIKIKLLRVVLGTEMKN